MEYFIRILAGVFSYAMIFGIVVLANYIIRRVFDTRDKEQCAEIKYLKRQNEALKTSLLAIKSDD